MKIDDENAKKIIQIYESDSFKNTERILVGIKDNIILNPDVSENRRKELAALGYFIIKGYKHAIARQVKRVLNEGASHDEILKVLAFIIGDMKRFESVLEALNVLSYEENIRRDYISLSDDLGKKDIINNDYKNNGKAIDNLKIAIITGNNVSLRVKQAIEAGHDKKHILKIASDLLELYRIKDKIYGPENRNPIKPSPEEINTNIEGKLKKFLRSEKFKDFIGEFNNFQC